MRVLRWAGGLVVAAWAVLFVVLALAGRSWPWWFSLVPLFVLVLLTLASTAARAGRTAGSSPRPSSGSVVLGMADAQGIRLGHAPQAPLVYGPDEPQATELVVPAPPDPLAGAPVRAVRPPSDDR